MSRHGAPNSSHSPGPYWRRAHSDWRFWVGAVFLAVALIVYVMSDDLSLVPRPSRPPTAPVVVTP